MEKQQSNNQDEVPADVGSQLRQARIARDVELDFVADALCIPTSYVTAIEHNDLSGLPSVVFARGYVNAYARLLGISLDGEFDSPGEQTRPSFRDRLGPLGKLKRQTRPGDPWVRWTSLTVLVVVLVATLLWWQSQGDLPNIGVALVQAAVVRVDTSTGSVIIDPDEQVSALGLARSGPVQLPVALSGNGAGAATEADVLQRSGSGMDVTETTASPESGLEQISLHAVFSDASWIEVREAGAGVLFIGVKQAGESLALSSAAIVDVVIGNAAAVKLSYNDAPVDIVAFTDERNVAKIKLGL